MKKAFKILSVIVSVLIALIPLFVVSYQLLTVGADFGKYGEGEIFSDFNDTMSGRKTDFQKDLVMYQQYAFFAVLAISLPCSVIYLICDRNSLTPYDFVADSLCCFPLHICSVLLLLFNFPGIERIVILVLFYILALAYLILVFIKTSKNPVALWGNLALQAFSLLIALLIAPFIGAALVFFKEIFCILFIAACLLCGGGYSGKNIYITIVKR